MASMKLTQTQIASVRALEDAEGTVKPQEVLQAAREKSHPLHSLFDWNVKRAAEKFWLHQARLILGAVMLQVVTTEFTFKSPAYVSTGQGQGYRSIVMLKDDPLAAQESLIHCLETAAGHLRRALDLASPLGMSGEIDQLILQVMNVTRTMQRKEAA